MKTAPAFRDSSMSQVLILSDRRDPHTMWVSAGLQELDTASTCFDMRRYPLENRQTISLDVNDPSYCDTDGLVLGSHGPYHAIWVRRPGGADVGALDIHEDDREFIQDVHDQYDHEIWSFINARCADDQTIWVNPPVGSARASSKLLQHAAAKAARLDPVPTLISNDVERIRAFASRHGQLICKSFVPRLWNDQGVYSKALTSVIDVCDNRLRESMEIQPAIYQPLLQKAYELRIFVLDTEAFAIRIDSQADSDFSTDWRRRPLPKAMVRTFDVSADLRERLFSFMKIMNIVAGSFDFVVSDSGEVSFLEVNEAGQFLFLEEYCPDLPILDAFCFMLKNGTLSSWKRERPRLRLHAIQRRLQDVSC